MDRGHDPGALMGTGSVPDSGFGVLDPSVQPSHHRGSMLLTLKQCGHQVDQATAYAIWDRDNR